MGIIDTLSAGFDLVRRKPWLIVLPVVLDIALWIAPKLSVGGLMQSLVEKAVRQAGNYAGAAPSLQETTQAAAEAAAGFNLGSLLVSGYLNVPGLIISSDRNPFGLVRPIIEVAGLPSLLAWVAGLSLGSLVLGTLYLAPIAAGAREGGESWRDIVRSLPQDFLRLVGGLLLTVAILAFISLPMALTLGLLGLVSQGLASLAIGFALVAVLWVIIYLAFVPEAILLGRDGVLQAVGHSINIVRLNFWPTLGLLLLANVIISGLALVWEHLTVSTLGALAAIVGNAFVGTGLTAAVFIFYRERLRAWEEIVSQLRSQA